MLARYYSASQQRFISEDPAGLGAGVNLYGYTGNDPVDFIDPLGLDKKGPKSPACAAAQKVAADLAGLLDSASTESGWLAVGSGVGTVLAGAGEGITFGGDTPITLTFGALSTFFTTTSFVTGASAALLNSFANGNLTAVQNFDFSQLANLAAAAASKIPGIKPWADRVGDWRNKLSIWPIPRRMRVDDYV